MSNVEGGRGGLQDLLRALGRWDAFGFRALQGWSCLGLGFRV